MADDASECGTEQSPRQRPLTHAPREQIDVVHVVVDATENLNQVLGDLSFQVLEVSGPRQVAELSVKVVSSHSMVTSCQSEMI